MADEKKWEGYFYSANQLACCAISIKFDGVAEFIGSATYLAPGLFVTAKHVIEEPLNRIGIGKTLHENKKYGQLDADLSSKEFIIEAVQMLKLEEKIAQRWNIRWMRFAHDMDFAILTTNHTDGPISSLISTLPTFSVNIHPMPRSNEIVSYGFFGENRRENDQITNHDLTFTGRPGKILSLHLDVASVADPPVYEMDNKIEHMMSGGPVCNTDGAVIAVNSASLDHPEGDTNTERTIATPFMRGMFMEFTYLTKQGPTKTTLHKLAQEGKIEVIGHEHLTQTDTGILWSPNSTCTYCHGTAQE